jgi:hypothetical protein
MINAICTIFARAADTAHENENGGDGGERRKIPRELGLHGLIKE